MSLRIVLSILLLSGINVLQPAAAVSEARFLSSADVNDGNAGTIRLLAVAKAKVLDPVDMQQRAPDAIRRVETAVRSIDAKSVVKTLIEPVRTINQYRAGQGREVVTGEAFRNELKTLIDTASVNDTVVIYTHSHGLRNGFEDVQPLGGMVLDLPVRRPPHAGVFLWDEYADLILRIPAKNVVVLTMSCFSGALIKHLNTPGMAKKWKDREQTGRNFVVMTSQNDVLKSEPIRIGNQMLNPFTYAVERALGGFADGFVASQGKPSDSSKDGKLQLGEVIDYVLHATEQTPSDSILPVNTSKPQVTGSYKRDAVIGKAPATVPGGQK